MDRVAAAGLLQDGSRVAEYGSPHGGSWLELLAGRGLTPVPDGDPADVVLDCFGLMHAADQSAALAGRRAAGPRFLKLFPGQSGLVRLWPIRCGRRPFHSAARWLDRRPAPRGAQTESSVSAVASTTAVLTAAPATVSVA